MIGLQYRAGDIFGFWKMSPDEQLAHLAVYRLKLSHYTTRIDMGLPLSMRDLVDFWRFTKGEFRWQIFSRQNVQQKAQALVERMTQYAKGSNPARIAYGVARGFIVPRSED